jgi:hypothetical protein
VIAFTSLIASARQRAVGVANKNRGGGTITVLSSWQNLVRDFLRIAIHAFETVADREG